MGRQEGGGAWSEGPMGGSSRDGPPTPGRLRPGLRLRAPTCCCPLHLSQDQQRWDVRGGAARPRTLRGRAVRTPRGWAVRTGLLWAAPAPPPAPPSPPRRPPRASPGLPSILPSPSPFALAPRCIYAHHTCVRIARCLHEMVISMEQGRRLC